MPQPRSKRAPAPPEASSAARAAILRAALAAFAAQGFHGTSMRDIASRVGTSLSAIYYHFPSKDEILRGIMVEVTEDLIARLEAADAAAGPEPAARLAAIVAVHVRLHTERQEESFVGNTELRALDPESRRQMVALRDRVAAVFKRVVAAGIADGSFDCPYPAEATLGILTMCTAVAGWYRPGGGASPQTLAERHAALALSLVGHRRPSPAAR